MLKTFPFQIEIIYSSRRTVEISIKGLDHVLIRAPKRTPLYKINRVIEQKQQWIEKHLKTYNSKVMDIPRLQISQDSQWVFMGETYNLDIIEDYSYRVPSIVFMDKTIVIHTNEKNSPKLKIALINEYKKRLEKYLKERISFYGEGMKTYPKSLRIKSQKTLWGSCSSKGNLNFNWVIAFAPKDVIDYLVVHEMAHLIHMNHSKEFWYLVSQHMPDYKLKQSWLKEYNYLLKINV